MKTIAVWTIMAVVMIASQPSYAYGDLLFHGLLQKTIEHKNMPDVAPKAGNQYVVVSPGQATVGAPGFGVSTGSCMTVTSPVKPDPAHYVLKGKVWYHLDCVTPEVVKPELSTSTCTGSRTVVIDSFKERSPEELLEDLNQVDQGCDDSRIHQVHAEIAQIEVGTCQMWYPSGFGPGGYGMGMGPPPKNYVPYRGGYAHRDCVPRQIRVELSELRFTPGISDYSTIENCRGPNGLNDDCVRRNQAANIRVSE